MNDKFKDLALECIVENISAEAWVFTTKELEKFTELIIRECLGKVAEAAHARRDPFFAYSQILEHFGVEE